nr:hypothetical protein [Pandoravirus massiliensis]
MAWGPDKWTARHVSFWQPRLSPNKQTKYDAVKGALCRSLSAFFYEPQCLFLAVWRLSVAPPCQLLSTCRFAVSVAVPWNGCLASCRWSCNAPIGAKRILASQKKE